MPKTMLELRLLSGLSRADFAAYFNIPYRTLQNWELEQRQYPQYLLELMYYKLQKENIIK